MILLLQLLFWHALADFPLQGDYMAREKANSVLVLFMHCMIHAGGVLYITGSVALCLTELIAHTAIDECKLRGLIGFNTDQALHIGCKIIYAILIYQGVTLP